MTVSQRQARLIDDFSAIEDPQERLAVIVDRGRRRPPFPVESKTDANRVRGCISHVWITGELRDGGLHLEFEADSPLVKGLVALLIDLYEGAAPADVVATEPTLLDELGINRDLTATRRNGLVAARSHIKTLAEALG